MLYRVHRRWRTKQLSKVGAFWNSFHSSCVIVLCLSMGTQFSILGISAQIVMATCIPQLMRHSHIWPSKHLKLDHQESPVHKFSSYQCLCIPKSPWAAYRIGTADEAICLWYFVIWCWSSCIWCTINLCISTTFLAHYVVNKSVANRLIHIWQIYRVHGHRDDILQRESVISTCAL